MTIQITVIGLGQVGASIGLALLDHKEKIFRCGHDP
jgi:prephenate dehydrogenase